MDGVQRRRLPAVLQPLLPADVGGGVVGGNDAHPDRPVLEAAQLVSQAPEADDARREAHGALKEVVDEGYAVSDGYARQLDRGEGADPGCAVVHGQKVW